MIRVSCLFAPAIAFVILLALACGGGNGELKSALESMAEDDLAVMVLPREELGEEFADFEIGEDSGFVDNEDTADDTIDPDDTADDLEQAGRLNGYELTYSDPDSSALEEGEGVIIVASSVELFEDASAAADFNAKQVGDFQRLEGEELEAGITLEEVETFDVDLADEAIGLTARVAVEDATLYQTVVAFNLDRLVGAAALVRADDADVNSQVEEIARSLDERIRGLLLGEISATPVPTPKPTPPPTPAPPPTPTPEPLSRYVDDNFGYSFDHPSEFVAASIPPEEIETVGVGGPLDVTNVAYDFFNGITILLFEIQVDLDNIDLALPELRSVVALKAEPVGGEISNEQRIELDQLVGYSFDITAAPEGIPFHERSYFLFTSDRQYSIDCVFTEERFEEFIEACETVINSFQIPFTGVYRDTTEGFSLTLPQGWEAQETGEKAPALLIQNPFEPLEAQVFVFRLLDPEPVEEWLTGQVASYGEVQVITESPVQLGPDTSGYQAVFGATTDTGLDMREQWTGVIRGTQAFLIRVTTPAAEHDRLAGAINAFSSSFTLEVPAPFGASRNDSLFLLGGEILTLDPALYRGSPAGIPGAIFSGLVSLNRDLNVVPEIAEDWKVTGNSTVYTFHLRPDAVFHDGRQVTADDFKYSWERAADPAIDSPTARTYLGDIVGVKEKLDGEATEIAGLEVLDDLTLRVTIDAPKPYFLQKLVYPTAYVVDRNNVESGDDWTDAPNGTGPFKLKVWEEDELLILERNEQYYGGVPELAHVVYRLFAGRPMMMYEQGEIDVAGVSTSNIERAQDPANPLNRDLLEGTSFCTMYLAFNVNIPPFDDPIVRQAFAMALDMDKVRAVTLKGMTERASGIVPPGMPGHNPSLSPVPFDPSQASTLLTQSSYGGAEDLPPVVSFADDAMHWMWQEYLGVEVEAVSLPEPQDYLDRRDAKELPLEVIGWCADYPDPQNFLEVLFHSESEENHFGYSNPQVDGMLEEAAVEPDHQARMVLYQEAEQLILDDWVAVPLWHDRDYVLLRPYVKGYEPMPLGIRILQDVSIER